MNAPPVGEADYARYRALALAEVSRWLLCVPPHVRASDWPDFKNEVDALLRKIQPR